MDGELTEAHLKRISLPPVHWKCTLAQIPDSCPHKPKIQDWVAKVKYNVLAGRGLLLLGEYSQGKSGCAAICLKAAAAHGLIGFWVRAYDLPDHIINGTMFDDQYTVKQRAESVPLLIIDEVQIRDKVAYYEESVERLVRKRLDDELCTILTTNCGKDDFRTKFRSLSEALVEAVHPIVVSGYNFRNALKDSK